MLHALKDNETAPEADLPLGNSMKGDLSLLSKSLSTMWAWSQRHHGKTSTDVRKVMANATAQYNDLNHAIGSRSWAY